MQKTMRVLSHDDIRAILRAADELIGRGGRTLLAKILKGSREKKILELELDKCPVYGYFRSEKIDEIMEKIDWMIEYDFLSTEFQGKLPMIYYTDRGWLIEEDQRADEFLSEWCQWLEQGKTSPDMNYLKDRNRGMILLFLEKVKETGNNQFIPYLEQWEKIEYKKVRAVIQTVIRALESGEVSDLQHKSMRKEAIEEALKGFPPQDLRLKCLECGARFIFTIEEQKFFKQKGFVYPKRCKKCRDERVKEEFFF